jgi:hypothetical protein
VLGAAWESPTIDAVSFCTRIRAFFTAVNTGGHTAQHVSWRGGTTRSKPLLSHKHSKWDEAGCVCAVCASALHGYCLWYHAHARLVCVAMRDGNSSQLSGSATALHADAVSSKNNRAATWLRL